MDFYYFIQIVPYMVQSYDHLQVSIYTLEIKMTEPDVCRIALDLDTIILSAD
jgi:hypothetical protein